MAIFPNYVSQEERERILDPSTNRTPTTNNPFGYEKDIWMVDGKGNEFKGTSFDLGLLKASDPETFNTVSLSRSMVLPTTQNDSAMNGEFGSNTSTDLSTNILLGRRGVFEQFFLERYTGMNPEVVSMLSQGIYNADAASKEWRSRSGAIGIMPSVTGTKAGEDITFDEELGFSRSYYQIAHKMASQKYNERKDIDRGVVTGFFNLDERMPKEIKNELILRELVRLKQAPEQLLEDPNSEVAKEAVNASRSNYAFDEAEGFSTDAFPILEQEATARGLSGIGLRLYVYDEAHKEVVKDLHKLINSDPDFNTPEQGIELITKNSSYCRCYWI